MGHLNQHKFQTKRYDNGSDFTFTVSAAGNFCDMSSMRLWPCENEINCHPLVTFFLNGHVRMLYQYLSPKFMGFCLYNCISFLCLGENLGISNWIIKFLPKGRVKRVFNFYFLATREFKWAIDYLLFCIVSGNG